MKMKTLYINLIAILAITLSSCLGDNEPTTPVRLEVKVELPNDFKSEIYYANQTVTLKKGSFVQTAVTNSEGIAVFEGLIPDMYDISTSTKLSDDEYINMTTDNRLPNYGKKVQLVGARTAEKIFQDGRVSIGLQQSVLQSWLISKVYNNGRKDINNKNYNRDYYIEVFNNSDEILYADGLCIGSTEGGNTIPFPIKEDPDYIYINQVMRVPGSGTDNPILPGESFVIACSAIDHSFMGGFDLTSVNWENKNAAGFINNEAVPPIDLSYLFNDRTKFFGFSTSFFGLVLFETSDDLYTWDKKPLNPKNPTVQLCIRTPKSIILDGVDILGYDKKFPSGANADAKRLQPAIDAGFTFTTTTYSASVFARKIEKVENGRVYLEDTNNSVDDFIIVTNLAPRDYSYGN